MLVLFDITCVAFLLSLLITPWVRNAANRLGLFDVPDAKRKLHAGFIPRVGGIAVALAYILSLVFVVVAPYQNLTFNVPLGIAAALKLAPATFIILAVGLYDDIRGLKPWQKLILESIAAILAYYAGFGVFVLRGQPISDWISLPLTVLWLVGCANALNLIDGMDGLAAGVGVFATLTSFVAALVHGNIELAIVTAPLIGALMGFLRYNFNPASIFLGDSGSLTLGFLLGCFGAMWGQKSATLVGMTAPLIALAMPLLDTGLAIARRILRNQPIFTGDRSHIHHRLLDQGLTTRRAALILYGVSGVAAALSLMADVGQNRFSGLIIVLFCISAWMGIQNLGYAEFGIAGRLFLRSSLSGSVNVQLRLQQFDRTLSTASNIHEGWPIIVNGAQEFGLSRVQLRVCGQFLDSAAGQTPVGSWQLRVPLADDQFLNITHEPQKELHPLILSTFPKLVCNFLDSRIFSSHGSLSVSEPLPDDMLPPKSVFSDGVGPKDHPSEIALDAAPKNS